MGQRVVKFDPTSADSARFNPLQEIRLDANLIKDVQNIATMIVDPDGKGLNPTPRESPRFSHGEESGKLVLT
ncbi:MAG: type IV secretory system conjugative DNA transfer family protein [Ferrovum myxofaciens]|uniref:Type IV secretory system conjugative DNA transfer family protein n=1 Tax=Ferrovum myxofaciens TaxID=416213 RepID=A0A9E6SZA7_9PROT|nr:type IV secretory system conjugative DNA transfer family protein [Ferrovum myxofaciens]QSH81952.1 MAG: type IV secretory system conjugative DNA transfer family protein [Ferrovum myxofaciens]QWY76110.1 MAG: type IV secretory system conjugative DNA transfer family protein [Ferrovum myxofaciens]QWY78771.1 MAG: type IV secretory system conjugative DNA transfer family protein [Ferrovum myxofaciens]